MAFETVERVHALGRQGIDWDYVVESANRHGVMPLVYKSLQAHCPQIVPNPTMQRFRRLYCQNAIRNLRLVRTLIFIL